MVSTSHITREIQEVASISYPSDASVQVGVGQRVSVTIPNSLVKAVTVIGLVAVMYHAKDIAVGTWRGASLAFRYFVHLFKKRPQTGTAVIYGAATKIGRAFAVELAKDGLNLILIDFSKDKLAKLYQQLGKQIDNVAARVVCCPLASISSLAQAQSDGGLKEIYKTIEQQRDIAYFVNCRSLKKRETQLFHEHKSEHIMLMGYYNMTMLAVLLRKVLKLMSVRQTGRIISVNATYGQDLLLRKKYPLFYATTQFSLSLIDSLRTTYTSSGIHFLIVNNDCRKAANVVKYKDLVQKSLNVVGLKEEISC